MSASQFDKDFGYLMPFLKKVAEAANTIADPAAREELKRLVAGEQTRWLRIRELLSGVTDKPAPAVNKPAAIVAQVPAEPNAIADAPSIHVRQFTVGSLRPR
jgi:hypothetical protein